MKREGVLTLLIAATGFLGIIAFAANYVDRERADIEGNIVRAALAGASMANANALRPQAYWTEAYDKLVSPVSPAWARENLGPYAAKISGASVVLVFDSADRPIYSYGIGSLAAKAGQMAFDRGIAALARRAKANRANPPLVSTGFVSFDGRVYLGAASLVAPTDGRPIAALGRKSVEIYLQEFDADRLAHVQSAFGISHLQLSARPVDGRQNVMLGDITGKAIAYLNWTPRKPGSTILIVAGAGALLCFLLVGYLLWRNLLRWHAALQKIEASRAEAEQLNRDNWLRTMFLANISHEFRTPLNAILGFSSLLKDEVLGPLGQDKYREYARDINKSGTELLTIINHILFLASKRTLEPQDAHCCAAQIFAESVDLLLQDAERKNVTLRSESHLDATDIALSESDYRQIVYNLGANAIKFSENCGTVQLLQRNTPDKKRLELIVKDSGCGIPDKDIGYLGRPFYRVESSFSRGEGCGLGLAMVRKIVEMHGGTIAFTSKAGQGTAVCVRLPLRSAPPAAGNMTRSGIGGLISPMLRQA